MLESIQSRDMWAEKLSLEEAREIYETCMCTDFPPEEIKPFSIIEKMWKKENYCVYGFYEETQKGSGEGERQGSHKELCAYAFLLGNHEKRVLLLDYFAVCMQKRGGGYGSHALVLLCEKCAEWNALVIEVEDDELASISEEVRMTRRRRISFYLHAGCLMTSTRSRVWDVNYRIMVMPLKDRQAEQSMAEKVTALYGGMYNREAMEKHFEITAV